MDSDKGEVRHFKIPNKLTHLLAILFGLLLLYEASSDPYLRIWRALAVPVGLLNIAAHAWMLAEEGRHPEDHKS